MILIELNQLLKESVTRVATENALKLDQKLLEQVEFEISAEQLRVIIHQAVVLSWQNTSINNRSK